MKKLNHSYIIYKGMNLPTPETEFKLHVYYATIVKWIDSCITIEQLELILPFMVKYRFMQDERGWCVFKSIALIKMFNLKAEMILTQKYLDKLNQVTDKYNLSN